MNEVLADVILEGLVGLRKLLAGNHLRPAEMAVTLIALSAAPERAQALYLDGGKQSRWLNVNEQGT